MIELGGGRLPVRRASLFEEQPLDPSPELPESSPSWCTGRSVDLSQRVEQFGRQGVLGGACDSDQAENVARVRSFDLA
jgi:hypothetical protein